MGNQFHVAKNGCDTYAGSLERPLKTIQAAVNLARPGDKITVHEGIYREYVNPQCGGISPDERIIYEAAEGEKVIISGGEIIKDWIKVQGSVYKAVLNHAMFGAFNPYRQQVCGDWFETSRTDHVGEVYINGKSLFEVNTLEATQHPVPSKKAREPEWSVHTWYCESNEQETIIYANFQNFDPAENVIEINVRRFCFWPEVTGINYITVRGFAMTMAATNWAPPTALQEGLIGPHWSKGWIIENNEISNSKCSGISLGKEMTTGHNEWVLTGDKHGTQFQRDAVFSALHIGWSKETIGSHIIRNNVIHDCEQTGICGHLGCVFSEIYDNHIYDIHTKRMFAGAEIGGIKLHAAIDVLIKRNHVHNCDRGFWMDWQAQGTRITENLMYDNDIEDIYVEVSHGPYIIDNNILLSMKNIKDMSHGGAFVNNLFAGFISMIPVPDRFTPYHFPHETAVAGVVRIMGGDNRFFNNIFTGSQKENLPKEAAMEYKNWYHVGVIKDENNVVLKGLSAYDECPTPAEWQEWRKTTHNVLDFAAAKLPMYCASNLYFGDAHPYKKGEVHSQAYPELHPQIELIQEGQDVYIAFDFGGKANTVETKPVTSDILGYAFQSKARFENADGAPICIENDFFGHNRPAGKVVPGPFAEIKNGYQKIKVGEIRSFVCVL